MSRRVTIIMDDKTAILLMDFLGMHSKTTAKNLYETTKNGYSDNCNIRFEDDYPNYDPEKAYALIEKLYNKLSDELAPSRNITIAI